MNAIFVGCLKEKLPQLVALCDKTKPLPKATFLNFGYYPVNQLKPTLLGVKIKGKRENVTTWLIDDLHNFRWITLSEFLTLLPPDRATDFIKAFDKQMKGTGYMLLNRGNKLQLAQWKYDSTKQLRQHIIEQMAEWAKNGYTPKLPVE